jgi:hypothetical protein
VLSITVLNADQATRIIGRDLTGVLSEMTMAVAEVIQSRVQPYPAATAANFPVYHIGPHTKPANYGRWYTRGYGPQWSRKDGSIGGSKTSEQLEQSWSLSTPLASRTSTVLGNRASYAKYLHSSEEQVGWAGARGWVTDKTAIEQTLSSGDVARIAAMALAKIFGS